MFLNLEQHQYDTDIVPFIRNGIIIDTSVLDILINGIVDSRIGNKQSLEFQQILDFLDLMKVNNRWDKFFITPHIFTEVCNHFRNRYSKWDDYKKIVGEIIPIIETMQENIVPKDKITQLIDFKNPVIEIGDMSIFVTTDDFINSGKRVAILSNDRIMNSKYQDHKRVMIMDYQSVILNR
ncbi:MAG: hypothetical protein CO146_00535 [Candidatus Nealsonbacteria bacterium CG_4_9_14_3_um_filter_37_29]|uniref:PIN domain-containing protein n=1 Tax=Candidatus Nealsonbacteria bacterium CG_4_9_14_3_um_filter_37_29 TaxID=1974696 RepID=A0A2M7Z3Z1_9BACT|nr:MAG: hypothetical protein CO146_00535 [Candidatus Nealsonbacteria bacterium CG_4_9_14_3_um_filter_37_29]